MRFLAAAFTLALIAAGATVSVSAQDIPKPTHYIPNVKVTQCFVTVPKAFSKQASGTQIVYQNLGSTPLSSVTFAVGYRNSGQQYIRKVVDQGTFAPHATVDHHFQLYNDVTFGGKATFLCGAIAATH
jgi:hypothetical protein